MNNYRNFAIYFIIFTFLQINLIVFAEESINSNTLKISLKESILKSLENNQEIKVEKYNKSIFDTYVSENIAKFDPLVKEDLSLNSDSSKRTLGNSTDFLDIYSNTINSELGLTKLLNDGSQLSTSLTNNYSSRVWTDRATNLTTNRIGLGYLYPILRGRGIEFNSVSIKQAKIDSKISQFEFRGIAEKIVSDMEKAYWNYYLSKRKVEIFKESLNLSEKQEKRTQTMVEIGQLPKVELVISRAETASRQEELITAKAEVKKNRLTILRLLGLDIDSDINIVLSEHPVLSKVTKKEQDELIIKALNQRPEINQSILQLEKGELELIRTKNGLLPKMDLFLTFGKTGYSNSFWESFPALFQGNYDASVNLNFEFPVGNIAAKSRDERAKLNIEKSKQAIENLKQLVKLDVLNSIIEVNRRIEQIEATKVTLDLQKEKLEVEEGKYQVGKSTTLNVAQTQRDLIKSQITYIEAVIGYINSVTDLYRLSGTLLNKRGIFSASEQELILP